ncbi:hypothetical protein B0T13DRAFT_512571 [Neurospora crassa]|nr:hypothetical protein B0T13DRAFT_512571 [Neurospora crassa]
MHQQQPLPDAHNDARFSMLAAAYTTRTIRRTEDGPIVVLVGIWNAIIVAVDHMRGKYLLNTAHSNRRMSVARPPPDLHVLLLVPEVVRLTGGASS